ncbi:MAG: hypothetical protein AB1656_27595 [Candidatus Omnitrophota bacterium]
MYFVRKRFIVGLGIWFALQISFVSIEAASAPELFAKDGAAKQWIWHPDVDPQAANRFVYFRKEFDLAQPNPSLHAYFAADANAQLIVNGKILRRKVTRYHPLHLRPEWVLIGPYLHTGKNVILVLHHNWGKIKNFQRQEERRAGLLFAAQDGSIVTDSSWRCAVAPEFVHHEQQIIGVIGDLRIRFPVIIDGSLRVDDLSSPDYKEAPPLEWKNAMLVADPIWRIETDIHPQPQRQYFFPVQRVVAAGTIQYPAGFSAAPKALREDAAFTDKMDKAVYNVDEKRTKSAAKFPLGEAIVFEGQPGETFYTTFDFHQPVHGYPQFECQTNVRGIAVSLGYGELNVSPLDGTDHTDPRTGKILTQGVVGTNYGDRCLTAGKGNEAVEFPDERTARYMTVHITFPENAPAISRLILKRMGFVKSQYPVNWRGSFDGGDPRIDQIVQLSKIHAEITMSDVYVDTPGREDGQWLEDIRLRAKIAESWAGDSELRKLTLLHADECKEDGKFLSFAPQSFVKLTGWDWGMQWIAMLHDDWKWNGAENPSSLSRRLFPSLANYVNLLLQNVDEAGLFRSSNVFADIRVGVHAREDRDVSVIVHCWLMERLAMAADIARSLKEEKLAGEWLAAREKMLRAFHKFLVLTDGGITYAADVYYDQEKRAAGKSQAAQISAILAGAFSPQENHEILDAFFPAPNGQAPQGIAPWNNPTYLYRALKVLSNNGLGGRALAHLLWRMSYYLPYSPNNPASLNLQGPLGGPLPEYFVSHQEMELPTGEKSSGQPGDPTGSHGWSSVALQWLHDSLLGVTWSHDKKGVPGALINLAPMSFGLPYVSGHVMTPQGESYVQWEPSRRRLEFDLPQNVMAYIQLPEEDSFCSLPPSKGEIKKDPRGSIIFGNGWRMTVCPHGSKIAMAEKGKLLVKGEGSYAIEISNEGAKP